MTIADHLDGQMLVAMPGIGDPRFERSVIFLCAHTSDGAMGIVVNKPAQEFTFPEMLARLNVLGEDKDTITLPEQARNMPVHRGGPVDTARGFVLHTSDYCANDATMAIDDDTGLTATIDVLKDIATGQGPRRAMLALGYAGWAPGQLEDEILHNGWLHCPADDVLMYSRDLDGKYLHALNKLGIDPMMLSGQAGHA